MFGSIAVQNYSSFVSTNANNNEALRETHYARERRKKEGKKITYVFPRWLEKKLKGHVGEREREIDQIEPRGFVFSSLLHKLTVLTRGADI